MMPIGKMAYIPNYEVAAAYDLALQTGSWSEVANSISNVMNY